MDEQRDGPRTKAILKKLELLKKKKHDHIGPSERPTHSHFSGLADAEICFLLYLDSNTLTADLPSKYAPILDSCACRFRDTVGPLCEAKAALKKRLAEQRRNTARGERVEPEVIDGNECYRHDDGRKCIGQRWMITKGSPLVICSLAACGLLGKDKTVRILLGFYLGRVGGELASDATTLLHGDDYKGGPRQACRPRLARGGSSRQRRRRRRRHDRDDGRAPREEGCPRRRCCCCCGGHRVSCRRRGRRRQQGSERWREEEEARCRCASGGLRCSSILFPPPLLGDASAALPRASGSEYVPQEAKKGAEMMRNMISFLFVEK